MVATEQIRRPATIAVPGRPVTDPAGWTSEEMAGTDAWLYHLTDADIADLDRVVTALEKRSGSVNDIGRGDFSFPMLGATLAEIREFVDKVRMVAE